MTIGRARRGDAGHVQPGVLIRARYQTPGAREIEMRIVGQQRLARLRMCLPSTTQLFDSSLGPTPGGQRRIDRVEIEAPEQAHASRRAPLGVPLG